jgi:PEP-CTERM motif-containing protein
MRRRCVLPLLLLVALLHASPAWATSFTFESLYDPATGRLTVNVDVQDVDDVLPGSFGILGFDFNLAFNPQILSGDPFFDVEIAGGNFLDPTLAFVGGGFDILSGAISVFGALLGPVPTGALLDGRLATISFLNIAPGVDPGLLISSITLSRLIDPAPGAEVPADLVSVTRPQANVPEPSTLMLVALGALALRRARRPFAGDIRRR